MAIHTPEFVAVPVQPELQQIVDDDPLISEDQPGWGVKIGATVAALTLVAGGFILNRGDHKPVEAARIWTPAVEGVDTNVPDPFMQLATADAYVEQQQKQLGDFLDALAAQKAAEAEAVRQAEEAQRAQEVADQARQQQAAEEQRLAAPASPVAPQSSGSDSDQAFLACTRSHESDSAGGYSAVSPDGLYYGAYQFLIGTWNNIAAMAGRSDLVGVRPDQASPADQDAMALFLYHMSGNAPWGGRC